MEIIRLVTIYGFLWPMGALDSSLEYADESSLHARHLRHVGLVGLAIIGTGLLLLLFRHSMSAFLLGILGIVLLFAYIGGLLQTWKLIFHAA